jgi:hypothetical protein
MIPRLRIRSFKASEDSEAARAFVDGQTMCLAKYGIKGIASQSEAWLFNPNVYALIAEDCETGEVICGVRLHVKEGQTDMPFEGAIEQLDADMHDNIQAYSKAGAAEICGIWKAEHHSHFHSSASITRGVIALAHQLDLQYLFAFGGTHSVGILEREGFGYDENFSRDTEFVYPNKNYRSIVTLLDMKTISERRMKEFYAIMNVVGKQATDQRMKKTRALEIAS